MGKKQIETKLVKQFINGDTEAFSKIYNYYKGPLFYFIFNLLHNTTDAEDVLQETFVQVIKKIDSLQQPKAFHPWLYRIAYNNAMEIYRKKSNLIITDQDYPFENIEDINLNLTKSIHDKEVFDAISIEIYKLSDIYRQIAQLRYFENMTTKEISQIMNIPEGTIKSRLKTIRQKIQPALHTKGFSPKNYFSTAFTPVIFHVFQNIISNNGLSSDISLQMYENISTITGKNLGILTTSTISAVQGVSFGTKLLLVLSLTGTITATTYITTIQPTNDIKQISYHNALTNKSIEVEI
ncbi:MAG: RNA polymerase sigma factor, partial [Coprobacillaceae bacterium]